MRLGLWCCELRALGFDFCWRSQGLRLWVLRGRHCQAPSLCTGGSWTWLTGCQYCTCQARGCFWGDRWILVWSCLQYCQAKPCGTLLISRRCLWLYTCQARGQRTFASSSGSGASVCSFLICTWGWGQCWSLRAWWFQMTFWFRCWSRGHRSSGGSSIYLSRHCHISCGWLPFSIETNK